MKKTLLTLTLLASLLMTGCSAPDSGTIIEKEHEIGEMDKKRKCAQKIDGKCKRYKTVEKWDDDDYSFLLRDGDKEGWVEVEVDDFNRYNEGDFYSAK